MVKQDVVVKKSVIIIRTRKLRIKAYTYKNRILYDSQLDKVYFLSLQCQHEAV